MNIKQIFIYIAAYLLFGVSVSAQPVPYKALNSSGDDYAASFRTTTKGVELWITTSQGMASARSRKIMRAMCGNNGPGTLEALPFPINQNVADNPVALDGCPTFAFCDNSMGIFVSNRLFGGKNYDNDLYELAFRNGQWSVKRLDNLCSAGWDDTPALSSDGSILYFSSDRRNPGSRKTDVFYSYRLNDGWSDPKPLDEINTPDFSEQTPFPAPDGFLYYCTNQTEKGDYDIWRVELNSNTSLPEGKPEPVKFPGVNQAGSDEGHPFFSPGGNWFLFSSNRAEKGVKDFDVYWVKLNTIPADTIQIQTMLRTRTLNPMFQEYEDATKAVSTTIVATDRFVDKSTNFVSDALGKCTMSVQRIIGNEPSLDQRVREIIMRAESPSPQYISATDTLIFDVWCGKKLSHTLYLWDTAVYFNPECKQDFPVTNVQFFITGYWCPTTKNYASYTPCKSIFPEPECLKVESPKPEIEPCKKSDDLYRYAVKEKWKRVMEEWDESKIDKSRQPGSCISMDEAKNRRDEFSIYVDSAVVKFTENMRSALRMPCVQRSIHKNKPIKIEVIGWTDPDPLDNACLYTGPTIDFSQSFVTLENMGEKPYIKENILHNGEKFRHLNWAKDAGGNQLLSDLRAYFTAVLLDSVWMEMVPEYRELRSQNGRIQLVAVGKAVSQDKKMSKERQRSVNVRVSSDVESELAGQHKIPKPGDAILLCGQPCSSLYTDRVLQQSFSKSENIQENQPAVLSQKNEPQKPVEIDEKPAKIAEKPIKVEENPVKIEKKPATTEETRSVNIPNTPAATPQQGCFAIQYCSVTDEQQAQTIKAVLLGNNITDARMEVFVSGNGKRFYRVRSGCYPTANEAATGLQNVSGVVGKLNLPSKPTIVR